jgi:hypothetical protein
MSRLCLLVLGLSILAPIGCQQVDMRPVDQQALPANQRELVILPEGNDRRAMTMDPGRYLACSYSYKARMQQLTSIFRQDDGNILVIIINFEKEGDHAIMTFKVDPLLSQPFLYTGIPKESKEFNTLNSLYPGMLDFLCKQSPR